MNSKKKRRRARARPTRTPGRSKRSTGVDRRVSGLRRQLKDKEDSIASVREKRTDFVNAQQETEESLSRLESQARALRDTISAVDTLRTAIARNRQAAKVDLKEAATERARLRKQVRKDERFTALREATASVDRQARVYRTNVKRLEKRVKEAQRETDNAAKVAADMEASRRDRREQLRALPERFRVARVQLANLRAAMRARADSGQALETYWLESDFDAAFENLRAHTDRKQEGELIGSLLEDGAFANAREHAEGKAKVLSDLKGQLASAQRDLQKSLQDREGTIRARLGVAP